MHCRERARRQRKGNEPAAVSGSRKALPNRACAAVAPSATTICGLTTLISASSQESKPRFRPRRVCWNAPRSARHPFEVFDNIGDVGLPAVDPCLDKTAVQQPSRRSDEGMAGEVFGIARLLAHEHDRCSLRSFAEHGLCGVLVQIAGGASSGGVAQRADCRLGRNLDADAVVVFAHWTCPVPQHIPGKRRFRPAVSTANGTRLFLRPCHGKVPNRRPSTEI